MKKRNLIIFILTICFLLVGTVAMAGLNEAFDQDNINLVAEPTYDTDETSKSGSIDNVVATIIRLVISVLGLIFMLIIFLAADLWMKANGNPDKVLKAKKMISQSLIGLSFVLIAYALAYILTLIFSTDQLGGINLLK